MDSGPQFHNITKDGKTVVLTPKTGNYETAVIFLHGIGSYGAQWQKKFSARERSFFPMEYKVILPTAELKIDYFGNQDVTTWYTFDENAKRDMDSVKQAAKFVEGLIQKELDIFKAKFPGNSEKPRIILSGHSLGCELAFYVGLTYEFPQVIKAIIGHSGRQSIVDPILTKGGVENENRGIPMLAIHGTADDVVPLEEAEKNYRAWNLIGRPNFEWTIVDGLEHSPGERSATLSKDFISRLSK